MTAFSWRWCLPLVLAGCTSGAALPGGSGSSGSSGSTSSSGGAANVDGGMVGDAGAVGMPCSGLPGECPTGQSCVGGTCVNPGGEYQPGNAAALQAATTAMEVACQRLYSDCSAICDSPFAFCGNDEASCTQNYARNEVQDLEHPFANQTLASICASQVAQRSCQDLRPRTVACDNAVVEGCPNDQDMYGANYGFAGAFALGTLPRQLSIQLCDDVDEWFSVDLQAGDALVVSILESSITGSTSVTLLPTPEFTDLRFPDDVDSISFNGSMSGTNVKTFRAVTLAGRYLLRVRSPFGSGTVLYGVGTEAHPPVTQADLAREALEGTAHALCARVHGDCASVCSPNDSACGTTAAACEERILNQSLKFLGASSFETEEAQACTAALTTATCGAFRPEACAPFFSGCQEDPAGMLRAISWSDAPQLTLPVTISAMNLCDDRDRWLAIPLAVGERLTVTTVMDIPGSSIWGALFAPTTPAETLDRGGSGAMDTNLLRPDSPGVYDAATVAGVHWLQLDMSFVSSGTASFTFSKQ